MVGISLLRLALLWSTMRDRAASADGEGHGRKSVKRELVRPHDFHFPSFPDCHSTGKYYDLLFHNISDCVPIFHWSAPDLL